jgi:dTDP-4-dehydrorhamnose 3,5-epimerase
MALRVRETTLPDARLIVPDVFQDERGYFKETYSTAKYRALGITDEFVQDSVSYSRQNVIRGLHGDPKMSKLVQVLRGEVWEVIVDLRDASPTYRKWEAFTLSESNHHQLYIPAGFLNGFITLSTEVLFAYKHGALYDPARQISVRWDDPTLAIPWPVTGEPVLSEPDRRAPYLDGTFPGP